jgi:2-hydroxy-6-oxonona-2,4-dienedioate hydrolase
MTPEPLWATLQGVDLVQRYRRLPGGNVRTLEVGSHNPRKLLFLHGINGHSEAYIRNLAAHAGEFHVVAFDFFGHGYSDKPLDVSYEIDYYVDQVLGLLDVLGAERAVLSGESLGGWVSARLAVRHPERVERLVLNTPGGLRADERVMQNLKRLTLEAVTEPTMEKVRSRLAWLFKDPATIPEDLVSSRLKIYSQAGYRDVTLRTLCLQEMDVRLRNMLTESDLESIRAPTLLVWTTADPMQGVDVGEWCNTHVRGSQLVVLEHSGHWPQFEEPAAFNEAHLAFLGAS